VSAVARPGWRAVRLAAVFASAAAVAGCVGMPAGGPVGAFSASPAGTAQAGDIIGPFPSAPKPGWTASQVVTGFLTASASYPADATIARQYLTGAARGSWHPGWSVDVFSRLDVPPRAEVTAADRQGRPERETVDVTGEVQATFNGTGQYVAAQGLGKPAARSYPFRLVKVNGQWRITNPPGNYRMLTAYDFSQAYKAQDLYFFDPADQVLVPDSVFVPLGASPNELVTNLVSALIQGPQTPLLQDATDSDVFPAKTTVLGVTLSGDVAVVNLGGPLVHAGSQTLERVSAELVWTLTGSLGGPQNIQAVELELDAHQVAQPASGCGTGPSSNPVQKLAAYACYSPYPSAPASFYYVDAGQAWSRCGWESQALAGSIGTAVPVFGRGGAQQCRFQLSQSAAAPPPQQSPLPPLSMAAVSPDRKYLAGVSAGGGAVYIRPLAGGATSTARLGPGITALSWDRADDLWVAQGGNVFIVSVTGRPEPVAMTGLVNVTGLSVAPDGVRVALIVQGPSGSQPQLLLAAVSQRTQTTAGSPGPRDSLGPYVELGPNVADPMALTWYDADDLIVLSAGDKLWQVPVDGQQASGPDPAPQGAVSVTADGPANALVAGLSGGRLAVSADLDGPWQILGSPGQAPAYPSPQP
jgi:hypothetical protein